MEPTFAFEETLRQGLHMAHLLAALVVVPGAIIVAIALLAILLPGLGIAVYSADGHGYSRIGHLLLRVVPGIMFAVLAVIVLCNLSVMGSIFVPLALISLLAAATLKAFAPA